MGGGAEWIWNIANQHFPGALRIVDIWRARELIRDLAAKLFAADDSRRKSWVSTLRRDLPWSVYRATVVVECIGSTIARAAIE